MDASNSRVDKRDIVSWVFRGQHCTGIYGEVVCRNRIENHTECQDMGGGIRQQLLLRQPDLVAGHLSRWKEKPD